MIVPVLVLPGDFWGMDGVWMSITAGEVMSILYECFIYFQKKYRKQVERKRHKKTGQSDFLKIEESALSFFLWYNEISILI